jgi:hypothetical protein
MWCISFRTHHAPSSDCLRTLITLTPTTHIRSDFLPFSRTCRPDWLCPFALAPPWLWLPGSTKTSWPSSVVVTMVMVRAATLVVAESSSSSWVLADDEGGVIVRASQRAVSRCIAPAQCDTTDSDQGPLLYLLKTTPPFGFRGGTQKYEPEADF